MTALLVHSDPEAMAFTDLALTRGISVPGELSIIAYDDEVAQLFTPALTAVSPPRASVGEAAVDLLVKRIADPDRPVQRVLLSPRLIVRESTAAARCRVTGHPIEEHPLIDPFEHSPWDFWSRADDDARRRQLELQRQLARAASGLLASAIATSSRSSPRSTPTCSPSAIARTSPRGPTSPVRVRAGRDCSMNPYTVIRGDVTLGDAVRIGAHTSILGFNHSMEPGIEVFRQPLTSRGIRIGDDVWVGSHVVILDGVTVGDHAVLAAGAVVTKDVPAGAIVGGNPARFMRWRVAPEAAAGSCAPRIEAVRRPRPRAGRRTCSSARGTRSSGSSSTARGPVPRCAPSATRSRSPTCCSGRRRRRRPSRRSGSGCAGGRMPHPGPSRPSTPTARSSPAPSWDDPDVAYHVLCVGYALRLLDDDFPAPLGLVGAH